MAADTDHFNIVDRLADRHEERLAESLVTLEKRVTDLMASAPLKDGELFDLEWALNARTELRQAISEEYLTQVDSVIRDYGQVADGAVDMLGTYSDVVAIDKSVVNQLQQMTFQGMEDLGVEYLDVLAKQVYESTLTGATLPKVLLLFRQ